MPFMFTTSVRPIPRMVNGGTRRCLALASCLAIMAFLPPPSKAAPIQANIAVSVGPLTGPGGVAVGGTGPQYQYSGTIPDVNSLPSSIVLSGPTLGNFEGENSPYPWLINVQAPFNMTITLDGTSGSHPSIDIVGNLTGGFQSQVLERGSIIPTDVSYTLWGSATSASLHGWTTSSGIPMSTITPLLNLSTYSFPQENLFVNYWTKDGFVVNFTPPPNAETPEPTTVLMYLAVIAGLGARRGARIWRSRLQR